MPGNELTEPHLPIPATSESVTMRIPRPMPHPFATASTIPMVAIRPPTEAISDPPPEIVPIFVDRTGRRKWLLRLAFLVVSASCVLYILALAQLLTDHPLATLTEHVSSKAPTAGDPVRDLIRGGSA